MIIGRSVSYSEDCFMEFITSLPIWLLSIFIFVSRVMDVSLGTIRTISIVGGWIKLAVVLGFFEVLLWIVVVAQVIDRMHESPWLMLAYAGGFAAGNAVGIKVEQKLAFGTVVIRMISTDEGEKIAEYIRKEGYICTTFNGKGRDGEVKMIYVSCKRKESGSILAAAQEIDPALFYVIERSSESGHRMHRRTTGLATGWRSVIKKK